MSISFRSAKSQASHAVRSMTAHGTARHDNQDSGKIHSLGTERAYEQALAGLTEWIQENKLGDLKGLDEATARHYLEVRAEDVGQKTLDLDRQAINAFLGINLDRIDSEKEAAIDSRAYTQDQIRIVAESQTAGHALATAVAAAAGLRAHELLTLLPVSERAADTHRDYRHDRFSGREGTIYTVIGKGGLCREVILPQNLADKLETTRLDSAHTVYDRGIRYQQHYAIGGGKRWSDSFSKAADRALGWSTGAHGVRHTYAQERVIELQQQHYRFEDAKEVVSQEMGHFRADIIDTYLR